MKNLLLLFFVLSITFTYAGGSRGGHYRGGKGGSSHKGSSYKNARTNNHYTKRKK